MQRTPLGEMACSLARSLDVAGEWWTPLIVRDVWFGVRRFDQIQYDLGVSRKVLANRLDTLVGEGVVDRRPYQERPMRYEYVLTPKGRELMEAFFALIGWGDRWASDGAGPPMLLRHKPCGETVQAQVTCSACGKPMRAHETRIEPGPGARVGRGTRAVEQLLDSDS
jgi:DNA-binding HxlR family transcriptional regulator